jgi:hypothetical protein
LLAPLLLVFVKGALSVTPGFLAVDVLLAEPEELVSATWTLVVKVVVLDTESDAVPEENRLVLLVETEVTVDGLPETVVLLPTVIG